MIDCERFLHVRLHGRKVWHLARKSSYKGGEFYHKGGEFYHVRALCGIIPVNWPNTHPAWKEQSDAVRMPLCKRCMARSI